MRILIEHGVVSAGDLRLLADPAWCSRQEDLWWTRELRRAPPGGRPLAARRRRAAGSRRGVDHERGAGAAPAGAR